MIQKLKYLFLFTLTFIIDTNLVLANNIIDFSKTGTITIVLEESDNHTKIEDVELTIYQIATATTKDNNLSFIYHENIQDCAGDSSDLSNKTLVSKIVKCITNIELSKQTQLTNAEGMIYFDNLELGLYLISQTNKIEGYSNIDPFLISIPKAENNKWIYNVDASPKTDIIKLIDLTVEKKWDTVINNNTPKEVTIELLKKDEIIDTIILNDKNNWIYTWKQIEKSDEYSVKEINIPAGYTATYRQEGNKFIVTNTKTLVQTGQNILIINFLTVLGLIFITIGIILEKRKSHE